MPTLAEQIPPSQSAEVILLALAESEIGWVLAARSSHGICAILLGDAATTLHEELQHRFKQAVLTVDDNDKELQEALAKITAFIEDPSLTLNLTLDSRGSEFQQRVWQALRQIPSGSHISYAELAGRIGQPTAVRAVAGACAANPLALAIPCHRVIAGNGRLSGYRWGVARKAELLRREKANANLPDAA